MAVYKIANKNIRNIKDFIKDNADLKRLLFYSDGKPLDSSKAEPNFYTQIIKDHIVPQPKEPKLEDEVKSFLSIYVMNSQKSSSNDIYNRDVFIHIDVICHESLWDLDNGDSRPLLILDEIDSKLPQETTQSSRGKLSHVSMNYVYYNASFQGYKLIYSITNKAKDCS